MTTLLDTIGATVTWDEVEQLYTVYHEMGKFETRSIQSIFLIIISWGNLPRFEATSQWRIASYPTGSDYCTIYGSHAGDRVVFEAVCYKTGESHSRYFIFDDVIAAVLCTHASGSTSVTIKYTSIASAVFVHQKLTEHSADLQMLDTVLMTDPNTKFQLDFAMGQFRISWGVDSDVKFGLEFDKLLHCGFSSSCCSVVSQSTDHDTVVLILDPSATQNVDVLGHVDTIHNSISAIEKATRGTKSYAPIARALDAVAAIITRVVIDR